MYLDGINDDNSKSESMQNTDYHRDDIVKFILLAWHTNSNSVVAHLKSLSKVESHTQTVLTREN